MNCYEYNVQFTCSVDVDTILSTELRTPLSSLMYVSRQSHISTDGHSVCIGFEPCLGLMGRSLLLFYSCCLVFCGAPYLTRGRVYVSQKKKSKLCYD
jgi:hypothetical protein